MKQAKERGVDDGHIFLLNRLVAWADIYSNATAIPPTCSMSGHRVLNTGANSDTHFYSATKFAITGITEGIRQELRAMNSGIKITVSSYLPPCMHFYWACNSFQLPMMSYMYSYIRASLLVLCALNSGPGWWKLMMLRHQRESTTHLCKGWGHYSVLCIPLALIKDHPVFCSPWSQRILRVSLSTPSPLHRGCRLIKYQNNVNWL